MAHMSKKNFQECIDNCLNCHAVCLEMIPHCLDKGGRHAESKHVGLLLDCAAICQTSAGFMLRNSAFFADACRTCARLCDACAEDCAKFTDDKEMQRCADVCRKCAESCHRMETRRAA